METINKHSVELCDLLSALRAELNAAKQLADQDPSDLSFELGDIEIEMQTLITREQQGDTAGKLKFWVMEAQASAKEKDAMANTQTLKIKLKPHSKTSKKPINLGRET